MGSWIQKQYTKSVVFYTSMMIKNKNKIRNHWSIMTYTELQNTFKNKIHKIGKYLLIIFFKVA